jgi:hypothetical protein
MTYFIRFPDEPTGMAALEAAGFTGTDEDGNTTILTASHDWALDVIGAISIGGEYDDEGEVIEPPTLLDGWHVNLAGELPEGWEDYVVYPGNPVRIFAGGGGAVRPEEEEYMLDADGQRMVRARNSLGQYVGDDPETPEVNEAWVPAP